jgi:hypothetical protein
VWFIQVDVKDGTAVTVPWLAASGRTELYPTTAYPMPRLSCHALRGGVTLRAKLLCMLGAEIYILIAANIQSGDW